MSILPELSSQSYTDTSDLMPMYRQEISGAGAREIGYLYGQYKRIVTGRYAGVLTGKGLTYGGLAGRTRSYRIRYRILCKRNAQTLRRRTERQESCHLRFR